MAVKTIEIAGIGPVKLSKRRGTKNIKIRLSQRGDVIVSLPVWLPFKVGEKFALDHREWITKHKITPKLMHQNMLVGKEHQLMFISGKNLKPTVKVEAKKIIVKVPEGTLISSMGVQKAALRGVKKALQSEEPYLNDKLQFISRHTGLGYKSANFKFMKSKWGSCRSDHQITLNYRLLDLPEELIDYVIVHELVHTKHLNHSTKFWALVEEHIPDYKQLRKQVKKVALDW